MTSLHSSDDEPNLAGARPDSPRRYWPELDGLRGAAVAAVVWYHFGAPGGRGGWLGVDVFFVLSGLVVANNLRKQPLTRLNYGRFLARRSARLFPVLLVAVAAVTVWAIIEDDGLRRPVVGAAAAAVAQGYNLFRGPLDLDGRAFTPLWSLGIEWQFYLVAPVLVAVLARCSTRRAIVIPAALAGLVALSRPVTQQLGSEPADQYLATWFRLDGLLLGVTACFLYPHLRAREHVAIGHAASVAAVVLFASLPLLPAWFVWQRPSLSLSIPIVELSTFVVVVAVASGTVPERLSRILGWRPLVFLGQRAYSIYLWHYLVGIELVGDGTERWQGPARLVVQIVAAGAVSLLSYRLVEEPMRRRLNAAVSRRWAAS